MLQNMKLKISVFFEKEKFDIQYFQILSQILLDDYN